MKKLYVIPGIIVIAFVLFAITFSNSGIAVNKATTQQITVHTIGCEGCKDIRYCIDGGPLLIAYSSDFTAEYGDDFDKHTICIKCCGDKTGMATFLTGESSVTVTATQNGSDCTCSEKKKK
ncbi:MAG: hypothetical protein AB2L26_12660 [Ignavibacteria bacterium]